MPLFGHHTQFPHGDPENFTAIDQLVAAGDRATLEKLAAGTSNDVLKIPGYNSSGKLSQQEAQYAKNLLSGNTQGAQALARDAQATVVPWTGGLLADALPAVAGAFLGPLGGAAAGGLEALGGVTNRSVLGGAALGGVLGAGGGIARGALGKLGIGGAAAASGGAGAAGGAAGGTDIPGAPGSGMDEFGNAITTGGAPGGAGLSQLGGAAGAAGQAAGGSGGLGSQLGSLFKTKSGGLDLGKIAQLGLTGLDTISGAQQMGKQGALQDQILAETQAQQKDRDAIRARLMGSSTLGTIPTRPDLGSLFAGSQNPFARGAARRISVPPQSAQATAAPSAGNLVGGSLPPGFGASGGPVGTASGTGSAQPPSSVQRFTGPMVNLQGASGSAPGLGPLQGASALLARKKAMALV